MKKKIHPDYLIDAASYLNNLINAKKTNDAEWYKKYASTYLSCAMNSIKKELKLL